MGKVCFLYEETHIHYTIKFVCIVRHMLALLPLAARDEAALCQQSDHRSVALRAKFGRPDGYKSCAIVGSSGLMLRSRLGAEIDAHEFVVRLVWMRGSNLLGSKLAATHPSHNTRGGAEPCARRRPGGHRGEQNVRAPDGALSPDRAVLMHAGMLLAGL